MAERQTNPPSISQRTDGSCTQPKRMIIIYFFFYYGISSRHNLAFFFMKVFLTFSAKDLTYSNSGMWKRIFGIFLKQRLCARFLYYCYVLQRRTYNDNNDNISVTILLSICLWKIQDAAT